MLPARLLQLLSMFVSYFVFAACDSAFANGSPAGSCLGYKKLVILRKNCNRKGLHPVFSSGVDTFLYAWTTMSTFAHWSIAHAKVTTTLPASSSASYIRWWRKLCVAIERAALPKRTYHK